MKKKHRKPADILRTIASPLTSKHLYYRNGLWRRNRSLRGVFVLGDPCSVKQVLDEHLFLQRRFRRKVFALIRSRKAPSWKWFRDGAFYYPHIRFPLFLLLLWLQKGTGGYANGEICRRWTHRAEVWAGWRLLSDCRGWWAGDSIALKVTWFHYSKNTLWYQRIYVKISMVFWL